MFMHFADVPFSRDRTPRKVGLKTKIPKSEIPSEFFADLKHARERLLVLDFDGTLAPFKLKRCKAELYPEVKRLVSAILCTDTTHVVVVSGRQADEVRSLLDLAESPPEVWGVYGLERITRDGIYSLLPLRFEVMERLLVAKACLGLEGLDARSEFKRGALAVHWRGLSGAELEEVQLAAFRTFAPLTCEGELQLAEFDGGVELRVSSTSKGDIVDKLLKEHSPHTVAAYLGDDFGDEPAFRAISGKGLSILVREQHRPTNADLWLVPPRALVDFLKRWLLACGGKA